MMRVILSLLFAITPALVRAQAITHTFSTAVGQPNGDFAIDLQISTIFDDDWNASQVSIVTHSGVTIASPLDNAPLGPWAPPLPDDGTAFDTYLRSPSAADAVPFVLGDVQYSPGSLWVAWHDTLGAVAPQSFLAARFALEGVGQYPGINALGSGNALVEIEVGSIDQLSGGAVTYDFYALYDGVPEPAGGALLLAGGLLYGSRRNR